MGPIFPPGSPYGITCVFSLKQPGAEEPTRGSTPPLSSQSLWAAFVLPQWAIQPMPWRTMALLCQGQGHHGSLGGSCCLGLLRGAQTLPGTNTDCTGCLV